MWRRELARYRRFGVDRGTDLLARLRARDPLFLSLADATEVPLSEASPGGRHTYVNAAVAEALGRAPAALLGQDHTALFPPAAAAALVRGDCRAQEGALPARQLAETELAGRRVELSIARRALRDEAGCVIGIASALCPRSRVPDPDRFRTMRLERRICSSG